MQSVLKYGLKHLIDPPVPGHQRLTLERVGHNHHPKVGFCIRPGRMHVALVLDLKHCWRKCLNKCVLNVRLP